MRETASDSVDRRSAITIVTEFQQILRSQGIELLPDSPLGHGCWLITDGPNRGVTYGPVDKTVDHREMLRYECGTLTLVSKVVSAARRGPLDAVLKHLRVLSNACPSTCQPLPAKAPPRITENPYRAPEPDVGSTRKLFELVLGLAALQVGTDVQLEDPEKSPVASGCDVQVTIAGCRIGLECKVPSGSMESVRDRVLDGVQQIRSSEVAAGYVVVNTTSLLDHDKFAPADRDPISGNISYKGFSDRTIPDKVLENDHMDHGIVLRDLVAASLDTTSKGGFGLMFYGQTFAFIASPAGIVPTTVAGAHYIRLTSVRHDAPSELVPIMRAMVGQSVSGR